MNLLTVLFLLLLTFVNTTSLSRNVIAQLNIALDDWKIQISAENSQKFDLGLLDAAITTVTSKIKTVSESPQLTSALYHLALETIKISSQLYENYERGTIHEILSKVYGLSSAFTQNHSEDELIKFFHSAIECIFNNGTDWSFPELSINPKNNATILETVEFIGEFCKNGDLLKGREAVMNFYFYYAEMAQTRGLIESLVNAEHPIACLLFINKYKEFTEQIHFQWVRLYFPYIHKVFNGHTSEPSKINVLLDFCKIFRFEGDVDWAILIFSANNIADVIYVNPPLLAKALDILIFMRENFAERFASCVKLLGSRRSNKLLNEMEKRSLKKRQIKTALSVKKLLPNLKLTAGIPIEESLKKWQKTLEEMNKISLKDLSPEDTKSIGTVIKTSFEDLYSDYQENPMDQIIHVLNAYIPLNVKLDVFKTIGLSLARDISSKYANILATEFAQRENETNLRDFAEFLDIFHGEVFDFEELVFQLNKFTKYWKLNTFGFKEFVKFLTTINWFHERLVVLNVQQRIICFLNSERDENQRTGILELVDYLETDLKALTKTEANLLRRSLV